MKKKIFSVALFVISLILCITTVNAQEKCKYTIKKADPITDEINLAIEVRIYDPFMFDDRSWYLMLERIGEKFYITSNLYLNGKLEEVLEKGDSLVIKLESGKLITCYAKDRKLPLFKPFQGKALTNYISSYPISSENFNLLRSEKSLVVKINAGPLKYYADINEKAAKKIQTSANCIINY